MLLLIYLRLKISQCAALSHIAPIDYLTYMSIIEVLASKVAYRMLFPLIPQARGSSVRRPMYIAEELWSLFATSHPDPEFESRIGTLRADLEAFVDGTALYPGYLFLLSPARDAVWEIRSTRDDPSIRVLGRFAQKDVFIATNYATRSELGGWKSRAWRDARVKSCAIWTNLFHTYQPIITTDVHAVASGAINGKYFKTE